MMRSMYAAVSGLRNHQIRMDVIGNNIANVNTVGFKSSRVTFQDTFYQMIRSGSAPDTGTGSTGGGLGGTTPRQVGIGMAINTIDTYFTQGAVLPTGNFTDLMIQGDGLFMVSSEYIDPNGGGFTTPPASVFYTRAGVFGFDAGGNLVNKSNGMYVVGKEISIDSTTGEKNYAQTFTIINIGDPATVNTVAINSQGEIVVDGVPKWVVGLAKFPTPEGLTKKGENLFAQDPSAGTPKLGKVGDTGFGNTSIVPGALEMSNVDL
ncbi:MAG: flagellar hook-basal body complex protein, partial [Clostridia bacterium]|nr:flagellar hook-basal body complex protein [Clostridia bacterium]